VEKAEGDPKQVNLVYTKGNKSERFEGRLEGDCVWKSKDGAMHTFTPLQVPKDTVLTVFYMGSAKKSKGDKTAQHSVIAISLPCRWQISKHFTDKTKLNFAILSAS
jgi:hypothetical protein